MATVDPKGGRPTFTFECGPGATRVVPPALLIRHEAGQGHSRAGADR